MFFSRSSFFSIRAMITILAIFFGLGRIASASEREPEVLIIFEDQAHASAKLQLLGETARASGVRIRHAFATALKDDDYPSLYSGAAFVLFDVGARELAEGIDGKAGAGTRIPMAQLRDRGVEGAASRGVGEEAHRLLHLYYHNGGRSNFENMFLFLTKELLHTGEKAPGPPIIIPEAGVYHPDLPGQVGESPVAYLDEKRTDGGKSGPVVGLVFPRAYIVNGWLDLVDDMIRQTEQSGVIPLPLFFSDRPGNSHAMRGILLNEGAVLANALIYVGALHTPAERRTEIESLGIPVLGTLKYRPGVPEDWRNSTVGVPMSSIPTGYSTPEYVGIIDSMLVATETRDNRNSLLREQFSAMLNKAVNLARLQTISNDTKRLVIFYYNSPPGEKNLSASNLNIPQSLHSILAALETSGYQTGSPGEEQLLRKAQRILSPFYRDGQLDALLREGLAETLPVSDYLAWFNALPEPVRKEITMRWGEPRKSSMVITRNGKEVFVIPRLLLGNVAVTRQPPRGDRIDSKETAIYHDTKLPPNHFYLACYLWARKSWRADALIHLGTHGSQEWMPGKERGLSIYDAPNLAVGDTPVVYPYIVANIGEAIQAKRRGRAVIISHQTPPYAPSGLYDDLLTLHELVHQYLSIETPSVRTKIQRELISKVVTNNYNKDMGWSEERIRREFPAFLDAFHAHLHTLADTVQPLGLHAFGVTPQEDHRLFTVLQMLGKPFYRAVLGDEEKVEELFAVDFKQLKNSEPYRLLERHVQKNEPLPAGMPPEITGFLEKARVFYANFDASGEIAGMLTALNGRHVPASTGDDPIRNPDSHPTGRNIYGFDPAKVPSRQAWEAGQEALASLIEKYTGKYGRIPEKLAFTLWSVETMRQHGVVEAQILQALGVRPVWDEGGRVTGVEIVPAAELGRSRIDVLVTASGAYRDMFPNALKRIEEAVAMVAALDEPGNRVRENSGRIAEMLAGKGMAPEEARQLSIARIFSNANGVYGLNLDDASLASDTWGEGKNGRQDRAGGEAKLADLYMSRTGYVWGEHGDKGLRKDLFAENLKKVDAAVLARSSNIYGVVNTDDPFQYLGGIALTVRSLTGKSPEMYISDLRVPGKGKTENVADFISAEMRTRYFHPNWISEMKKEGYSGTVEIVKVVNNFWGWQAMTPEAVRPDQWQELVDVYVRDKHKLGLKEWFEKENPHAQAQMIERMLEAVRKEYWNAPAETVKELKTRYRELAERYDVQSDNRAFTAFVKTGFGLGKERTGASKSRKADRPLSARPPTAGRQQVRGMQLQKEIPRSPPVVSSLTYWRLIPLLAFLSGLFRQCIAGRKSYSSIRRPYAVTP
jgi:cobaltochelatase CobN